MIAHRGASGLEPENSHAAFIAAGNRSYYGIETDVHVTADGRYVVIHDDNTLRTTGVDMVVEESKYDDLKKLHLLDSDKENVRTELCIPDLVDYIRICKRYGKTAVLELKNSMSEGHILGIIGEIRGVDYLSIFFGKSDISEKTFTKSDDSISCYQSGGRSYRHSESE